MASAETEFQYPPLRENFPLPIRAKISSGVSSGPLAKGVKLEVEEENEGKRILVRDYFNLCATVSEVLLQHVIQKQSLIISFN